MHALNCTTLSTGDPQFNLWAIELARTAHSAFVYTLKDGSKRMYWKMSIDLSFPLVPSMGQHDPLDGLVTYKQLQTTALEFDPTMNLSLDSEIADMESICKDMDWATDDSLGIGGLLGDAYRILKLNLETGSDQTSLLIDLLDASLLGLDAFTRGRLLQLPADYRLAFRELGLSLGLHAVAKIKDLVERNRDLPFKYQLVHERINQFEPYIHLSESIENFWLEPRHRESQSWREHRHINGVMLAASLVPEGYLR